MPTCPDPSIRRAAVGTALTLAAWAGPSLAQQNAPASAPAPAPPPPACQAAEHRQFDFWIGHWDVYGPAGRPVGENRITAIAGRCALHESWTGRGGVTGESLNLYDQRDRRWHQTWVDSSGSRLQLSGGLEGSSMVLGHTGPHDSKPGVTVRQRITWTPLPDGAVRQHWESSEDEGKTWQTLFDGRYVRRR